MKTLPTHVKLGCAVCCAVTDQNVFHYTQLLPTMIYQLHLLNFKEISLMDRTSAFKRSQISRVGKKGIR